MFPFVLLILLVFSSCAGSPSARDEMEVYRERPLPLGTVEIEFDKFFSSALEKRDVEVLYYARADKVALVFSFETVTYRQYWDKLARQRFIVALERYRGDYEAKNLKRKNLRAYGTVKGRAEWGQFSGNINKLSFPSIDTGYSFQGQSPYFTLTQRMSESVIVITDDIKTSSRQISLYFTRAQAADLAALFDETLLQNLVNPASALPLNEPLVEDYASGE
jgi:hypothetical protein